MELALVTQFTWIDGFALIVSLLGTILYGIIFYVLIIKKKSSFQERVVLITSLSFLFYFSGNFLALFSRALAQNLFQQIYTMGWIINLIGLSFIPSCLIYSFFVYRDYYLNSIKNQNLKNPYRFLLFHIISIYFLYHFIGDINNKTSLPWPVLTSSISQFQFKLFSYWLGICTLISGIISYSLKGNPNWKRFDNYFPINGIFLIIASVIIVIFLSQHPWKPAYAPFIRLFFLILAFIPGITLGYYLVRYQFLNVLIKPTIFYSVLTAMVIIIYHFGIRNIAQYLSHFDVVNVKMVEIILMVILVFIFHPIRIFLHRKMNQYFFMDTENYKTIIHDLSQALKKISNLDEIQDLLLKYLEPQLHIKNIKLITNINLNQKELIIENSDIFIYKEFVNNSIYDWMEIQELDLIGKIYDHEGFLGIVGIKLKTLKEGLNPNELHLINTILNQLAITIRNIELINDQIKLKNIISRNEKYKLEDIPKNIQKDFDRPINSIDNLLKLMEKNNQNDNKKKNIDLIRLEIKILKNIVKKKSKSI